MARPFVFTLLLSFATVACGHPATEQDCLILFNKTVEVEMKEFVGADQDAITKKQAALRQEFETDLASCVGKRVTEASMACIRGAQNKAELADCRR